MPDLTIEKLTSRLNEAQRLSQAVMESEKSLDSFRRQRTRFIRHFVGPYYGHDHGETTPWRQPLNLIYSLAATLEPALAMQNLRASITTTDQQLRPFANDMKAVLDYTLDRIGAHKSSRVAIRDAFYGLGITKTGWDGTSALPFSDPISLDDYVFDRRAQERKKGSYSFEGHRFRVYYEDLMDSGELDDKARQKVNILFEGQWERNRDDKAKHIAFGKTAYGEDAFRPEVELVELYIPHRDAIVWLPGNLGITENFLRDRPWYGEESGPYDILGYAWAPDNYMPVALMGVIFDLYLLENQVANKVARQAASQKDLIVVDAPSPDNADIIRKASDGDVIQAAGLKATVLSLGGANEDGYRAVGWFQDWLSRIAGNTDLIGGMVANSKTLGQDQMLMGNASVRINDMRNAVEEHARSIVKKVAWYIWNDNDFKADLTRDEGALTGIPVKWRPFDRPGEITDFDFNIGVYARINDSPEQRAERLAAWVQRYVLPLAPLQAQQGSRVNMDVLMNLAGRELDLAEINDLWEEAAPLESPAPVQAPTGVESESAPAGGAPRGGTVPSPIEALAQPAPV